MISKTVIATLCMAILGLALGGSAAAAKRRTFLNSDWSVICISSARNSKDYITCCGEMRSACAELEKQKNLLDCTGKYIQCLNYSGRIIRGKQRMKSKQPALIAPTKGSSSNKKRPVGKKSPIRR